MAIRTYKVTLDSKNTIAPEPVYLRQGDKTGAVVIDATLMDNGSPVSLSGLTPMFKANTADGQAVIADSTGFTVTDSDNGKFTYQAPNALSSVPGKITTAYFSFSDSSGTESTFNVAFIIKAAVDISQRQAEDYITIIDGTLNSLQKQIDAMNTDIKTILNAYNQGDFYNKSETDSKDSATLSSAKSYADSGDSATLSALNELVTQVENNKTKSTAVATMSIIDGSAVAPQSGSPLTYRRVGNLVYVSGSALFPKKITPNKFWQAPDGFKPDASQNFVLQPYTDAVSNVVLRVETSGSLNEIYGNNDSSPVWLNSVFWFTNDDFPS